MLHTVDQGVLSAYLGKSIMVLLESGCLTPGRVFTSVVEKREHGIQALQPIMWAYYKELRKASREDRVYGLNRMTLKMLGKPSKASLKAKAAETRSALGLVLGLLRRHVAVLGDTVDLGQCSNHAP
jgi:hypothetical protein